MVGDIAQRSGSVADLIRLFETGIKSDAAASTGHGRLSGRSVTLAAAQPRVAASLRGGAAQDPGTAKPLAGRTVTLPQVDATARGRGGTVTERPACLALPEDARFLASFHIDVRSLPVDLGAARVVKDTKLALETLERHGNVWEGLRKSKVEPELMRKVIDFRQRVVDGLINELRHPGRTDGPPLSFTASSVGSTALTSDYDVTFASPGTGHDIDAMRAFNAAIQTAFGAPPGIVFDTNIYVQDYVHVGEKIAKTGTQDIDNTPVAPGFVFEASERVDQQVMSLMKMRRTMDGDAWTRFTAQALAPFEGHDPTPARTATRERLSLQYSEADALVALADARLAAALKTTCGAGLESADRAARAKLPQGVLDAIEAQVATVGAGKPTGPVTLTELERREANRASMRQELMFQHTLRDVVDGMPAKDLMTARNAIYADLAGEVRAVEAELGKARGAAAAPGATQADKDRAASLHAQRMQLTGLAIYFAAEAYHSAGAVRHVVAGLQSGGSATLSLSDLQSSFMEQAGDARLHSHVEAKGMSPADREAAIAIKASKYVTRMLDALHQILKTEQPDEAAKAAAAAALQQLFGSALSRLPPAPADIALLMKYTLLSCKKGEVEVKKESDDEADKLRSDRKATEAENLTRILRDHADLLPAEPGGLRQAIQTAIDKVTAPKPRTVPLGTFPRAGRDGADLAKAMFALEPGESVLSRITAVAARFDAAMTGLMPAIDRGEMQRYMGGRVKLGPA